MNNITNIYFDKQLDVISQALRPILSNELSLKYRKHLLASPMIMTHIHHEDVISNLEIAIQNKMFKLIVIDARVFSEGFQKIQTKAQIHEFSHSNTSYLSNIDVSIIKKCCPCLLFFNNLDSLTQTQNNSSENMENHSRDNYVNNLKLFLDEIYNQLIQQDHIIYCMSSSKNDYSTNLFPRKISLQDTFTISDAKLLMQESLLCSNINFDSMCRKLFDKSQNSKIIFKRFLDMILFQASKRVNKQLLYSQDKFKYLQEYDTIISDDINDFLNSALTNNSSINKNSSSNLCKVEWQDIGGLDKIRQQILEVLEFPLLHKELISSGVSRRGILLYGPPGTGKTLVCKAVATECNMSFISIKGPELLDMYVGESEKNIRNIFNNAKLMSPCVLFFDELDSLAPARGKGSDSNSVMDRVVSQMLTEIDNLKNSDNLKNDDNGVFIMGATNRPDLLDPSLMRPGRFDVKIFLSVCKDINTIYLILQAQTRNFKLDSHVDLFKIAQALPMNITGADISGFTNAAHLEALNGKLATIKALYEENSTFDKNKGMMGLSSFVSRLPKDQLEVVISMDHLNKALSTFKPSISEAELARYCELHSQQQQ